MVVFDGWSLWCVLFDCPFRQRANKEAAAVCARSLPIGYCLLTLWCLAHSHKGGPAHYTGPRASSGGHGSHPSVEQVEAREGFRLLWLASKPMQPVTVRGCNMKAKL